MITLPVYLVIDVSASMAGHLLDELNQELPRVFMGLAADPLLSDMVQISVLTFSDDATVELPLVVADPRQILTLHPRQGTSYGPVLRLLDQLSREDVARLRKSGSRVFRPLAFFVTDGVPADPDWLDALRNLDASPVSPTIIALGLGGVDPNHLRLLAGSRGTAFLAGPSDRPDIEAVLSGVLASLTSSVEEASRDRGSSPQPAPPGWESVEKLLT